MKQFYGYVRVSTARQGEKGVSLEEQRRAITQYSAANGIEICEWFEERETAAKRGRPLFGRMIDSLKKRKVDGAVLHRVDRASRNLSDWARLGELVDLGIDIRFVHESLDLTSRGGRLTADLQAIVAADFIRNLKEESRKGYYGRLRQGLYPRRAPLGYVDNGGGNAKTIDPVKGPLVRRAFELYGSGDYSLPRLVEQLYEAGLRNRNGNRVTINGLATLLKNPFYMGLIRLTSTNESFPGVHEPLIPKALFDRVQDVFRGKLVPKVQRHEFVYRKLVRCRSCGYALTGELQKNRVYFRCHSKGCRVSCLRETVIDDAVAKSFRRLQFTDEQMRALMEEMDRAEGLTISHRDARIRALKLNFEETSKRMNRLTDAMLDKLIEKPEYEERKTALLNERVKIEERLQKLESQGDLRPQIAKIFELGNSATLSLESANDDEKRDLVQSLTSNLTVDGKSVSVELKTPFDLIAKRPAFTVGRANRGTLRTFVEQIIEAAMNSPHKN